MIIREFIVVNFKPIAITENDKFFQLFGAFCEVYEVIPYICSRGKFFRPITMPSVSNEIRAAKIIELKLSSESFKIRFNQSYPFHS